RDRLVDATAAIAARPVAGFVFGAIRNGRIDLDLTIRISEAAAGRPITFHRAFETLVDQSAGITELLSVPAVDRILTSGGPGEWSVRAVRLADLAQKGGARIGILVGGGVSAPLLQRIAAIPGIREVHVGRAARTPEADDAPVDPRQVAGLVAQLEAQSRDRLD